MRENRDFVVPVNILTPFAHAPFSSAARHTTVCLDTKIAAFCDTSTASATLVYKRFAFFKHNPLQYI